MADQSNLDAVYERINLEGTAPYSVGDVVKPLVEDGYVYHCTAIGASADRIPFEIGSGQSRLSIPNFVNSNSVWPKDVQESIIATYSDEDLGWNNVAIPAQIQEEAVNLVARRVAEDMERNLIQGSFAEIGIDGAVAGAQLREAIVCPQEERIEQQKCPISFRGRRKLKL